MHSLGIIIALNLDLVRASRVVTLKCESLGVACSGKFYEICSEVGTVESESSGSCVRLSPHWRLVWTRRLVLTSQFHKYFTNGFPAAPQAFYIPLSCLQHTKLEVG